MPKASKIAIGAAAALVVVVAGAGGAQLLAQTMAQKRVDTALASLPNGATGHYRKLGYNLFTRTLRIGDLVITRDGQPVLSVDRTILHHVSGTGTADDPFLAEKVRLVGLAAQGGTQRITIAIVDGQGIALLNANVPPPDGTPAWLVAPDGTLIGAQSLVANGLADEDGATVASVSISGYRAGHIDDVAAADFSDGQGHRVEGVSGSAIDLDGLDRVFNAARYTADAPTWTDRRPLIGHAEMNGFVNREATGASGSLDRVSIDDLAARPFASAPTPANSESTAFLRDAGQAVSLGSMRISGLRGADSSSSTTVSLHEIALKGYVDGALSRLSMDGFTMAKTDDSQLAIGHFDLTGLNVTKVLHQPASASMMEAIEAAGNGGARLDGMTVSAVAVTPRAGATITLASLAETVSSGSPVRTTVTMRGLTIPAKAVPMANNPLAMLGIDPLVLDLDEAWVFDEAAGTATIAQTTLTAHGLGTLLVTGTLAHLPVGQTKPAQALAAIAELAIGSLKVTYTNDTLVQRLIAMQAKESGKSVADVTSMAKLAGSFMAAAAVPDQPDAGEQIAAFIDNPKTLTVTASPTAPVAIGGLMGATLGATQKALNLHLSAD